MKVIPYPAALDDEGAVAYRRVGGTIYFTGLNSDGYSTGEVRVAEAITKRIALREDVASSDLNFFDIRTHRGFSTIRIGDYQVFSVDPTDVSRQTQVEARDILREIEIAFHAYIH